MRRAALLAMALSLSACGTYVAEVAPERMRGMTAPDLIACAGLPDQKMITRQDIFILEWSPKVPGSTGGAKTGISFSLPLGTSFAWTPPSDTCHMQATVSRDGYVYDVDLTSSNAADGADGACAQIVKQCVYHQSGTGLEKGYDAFHYFFPAEVKKP